MIDVKNLSKTFVNDDGVTLTVLKDVSFHVSKGEVVSIIGPSGTGKSTLLRCLNRMETPTGGQIFFKGTDVLSPNTDINSLRQKLGMVFQSFNLFENMTVLDNITFGPVRVLGQGRKEAEKEAMELLRQVGLYDKAGVMPSTLSGGQKQRAAIARCLSMKPDCILFDEPTSALDPTMIGEVQSVIRQLASHVTMLIVTHEMKFARDISTRVIFMDKGYILEDGTPEQVFENPVNEETRAFIQRLRSLHYDINDHNTDLYSINSDIEAFFVKYGIEHRSSTLQLIFEELLMNILKPYRPIVVDITYSELNYRLIFKALVKGLDHKILDKADPLPLSIIRGMSHSMTETVTPEGLEIEIR